MDKTKLSWVCFILAVLAWVPNLVFQVASPLFLSTFLLGLVGAILALMSKNYILMVLNIVMFCSFFIFMAAGYTWNSLT